MCTLFLDHRGPNSKQLNKSKQNSNKSHDSGFSDSAASDIVLNGTSLLHNREDRATSSQSLSQGSKPDSSEEDQPHCEIVNSSASIHAVCFVRNGYDRLLETTLVSLTLLTMAQFPTDSLWGGVVTSPSKFNISSSFHDYNSVFS